MKVSFITVFSVLLGVKAEQTFCPDGATWTQNSCKCNVGKFLTHDKKCVSSCDKALGFTEVKGLCECPAGYKIAKGHCVEWKNRFGGPKATCRLGFYSKDGVCTKPKVREALPSACRKEDLVIQDTTRNACVCIANAKVVPEKDHRCECKRTHFELDFRCVRKIPLVNISRKLKLPGSSKKIGKVEVLGEIFCGFDKNGTEFILQFDEHNMKKANSFYRGKQTEILDVSKQYEIKAIDPEALELKPKASNDKIGSLKLYKKLCQRGMYAIPPEFAGLERH
jgi:hypothetical protein